MRRYFLFVYILVIPIFLSCKSQLNGDYLIELYSQGDIHGRFFDSLYVGDREHKSSLANISTFIKERRAEIGNSLIYIDNGDHLQGDNGVYYYNYCMDYNKAKDSRHLFTKMVNYIGIDAAIVGNHDIEAGHKVYDKIKEELSVPYLAANAICDSLKRSYFEPYTILDKNGVKVAIIGMTNPNIKKWLPKELWSGITFYPIKEMADSLITEVKQKGADIVVLAIHAGLGNGDNDIENPAKYLAANLKGVDAIIAAHDHRLECSKVYNGVDSTLLLDGKSRAEILTCAKFKLSFKNGKLIKKESVGSIVDLKDYPKDRDFLAQFKEDYNVVKSFTSEYIGEMPVSIDTKKALVGASEYMNLFHYVQLNATGADISFAAPLTSNAVVNKGAITRNELAILHPYENLLYMLELSGEDIKNFLEYSYLNWCNKSAPTYAYYSAGGIIYKVFRDNKAGEKIKIISMQDGSPFIMDKKYKVAMSSYVAYGGGDIMGKGVGIDSDSVDKYVIATFGQMKELFARYIPKLEKRDLVKKANWNFI